MKQQRNAERLAYPLDEFCGISGHTRTAAYSAIREGKLRTFKIGRRRMVSDQAAREYIALLEAEGQVAA